MKDLRILVIRPGAIGDMLLTFPVLKALRGHYSGARITLVSNAQVLPVALAFGVADGFFDFQDVRWSELFSTGGIRTPFMQELLDQIDLAICWLRDPDSLIEHNLKAAGVKRLIIAPGRPPEGERIHIVNYLAHTAGLPDVEAQFRASSFSWVVNPSSKKEAVNQQIAVHSGSGAAQKCWPASCFAAVIEQLWQHSLPVLLLEGPADSERVHDVLGHLTFPLIAERFKRLTNAPLLEVARHLQQCRGYLGNDSGITHLAAMLGVPTVAIFGPSDPAVWRPLGPLVKVIQARGWEEVPVDTVIHALLYQL